MSEASYKITLIGYGKEKGKYYVEEELGQLFKIERKVAKELLESCPRVVKQGLDKETAQRYVKAVESTGALCEMEDTRFETSKFSIE